MCDEVETSGYDLAGYLRDTPYDGAAHSPLAWLAIDRALRFLDGKPLGPLLYDQHANLGALVGLAIEAYGRQVLPLLTTPLAIEGIGACLFREHLAKRQYPEPAP